MENPQTREEVVEWCKANVEGKYSDFNIFEVDDNRLGRKIVIVFARQGTLGFIGIKSLDFPQHMFDKPIFLEMQAADLARHITRIMGAINPTDNLQVVSCLEQVLAKLA